MVQGISVVIPNYNGRHLLERSLSAALAALKASSLPYEIIIPDDASTDDSVQWLKEKHTEVICLENAVNTGFSKNINRGIRISRYHYCLLLNSDVCLAEDFFDRAFSAFDDDTVFGIQAAIFDELSKERLDGAKWPVVDGNGIKASLNFWPDENIVPAFFLSGAACLVRTKVLQAMGGFNEIFSPFYYEDVDLGIRAWRLGYRCLFNKEMKAYHACSSTISSTQKKGFVKEITRRNKLILNHLHLNGWRRILWLMNSRLKYYLDFLIGRKERVHAFLAYRLLLKSADVQQPYLHTCAKVFSEIKGQLRAVKGERF